LTRTSHAAPCRVRRPSPRRINILLLGSKSKSSSTFADTPRPPSRRFQIRPCPINNLTAIHKSKQRASQSEAGRSIARAPDRIGSQPRARARSDRGERRVTRSGRAERGIPAKEGSQLVVGWSISVLSSRARTDPPWNRRTLDPRGRVSAFLLLELFFSSIVRSSAVSLDGG
jgi:hypothetical protein